MTRCGLLFLLYFFSLQSLITAQNIGEEWRVYIKFIPCSGRFDWVSVAKQLPTGGASQYVPAAQIFPWSVCGSRNCTWDQAWNELLIMRSSPVFLSYCCRNYSVWYKNEFNRTVYSIVLGPGTPGMDWIFMRANLCCEEAEQLTGLFGACSGSTNNNQNTQNTNQNNTSQINCSATYANSEVRWSPEYNQYLCFCKPGYTWNVSRTHCIPTSGVPDCEAFYPNTIAVWDARTNQYLCNCKPGYQWSADRSRCVANTGAPDCQQFYQNSEAVWDATTNQYLCYCKPGYQWNVNRTACIPIQIPDCSQYYANSYAAWDQSSNQYLCYCQQGFQWNTDRTACVSNQIPDCAQYYANSYAAWDQTSQQYLCYCNAGYQWNSSRTACVQAVDQNRDNPVVNPQNVRTGQCNTSYRSGSNDPEQYNIDLQTTSGTAVLTFDTYTVKDRIHVYYDGAKVFDSGCVGTSGRKELALNGRSSVFKVVIDPKCDPAVTDNTQWTFSLGCANR